MMAKARTPSGSPAPERRSGQDRRRLEEGPPGSHDRRRLVEPRRPDVEEIEMSPSEWDALNQGLGAPAPNGQSKNSAG